MTDCPAPRKSAFRSMRRAQRYAIKRALWAYRAGEPFGSMYGYRCVCGKVHVTQKKRWDGQRHPLLARLRPTRILVERAAEIAYREGWRDALEGPEGL